MATQGYGSAPSRNASTSYAQPRGLIRKAMAKPKRKTKPNRKG